MSNDFTGNTEVTKFNRQEDGVGQGLLATLRYLCEPDSPHHIGMFAGSLLPYASWAQPKVPH